MQVDDRLVIEALCASWAAGDLGAVLRGFAADVDFAVCGPAGAASFLKSGRGRGLVRSRLGLLLTEIEVVRFTPLQIVRDGDFGFHCRVHYHYGHRRTGMDIDGTMRHNFRMIGGRVTRFEIVHDAARMAAFLDLARAMIAEA